MSEFTMNHIERTKDFWSKRMNREISDEEARVMCERVAVAFTLLIKWDKREKLITSFRNQLASLLSKRMDIFKG